MAVAAARRAQCRLVRSSQKITLAMPNAMSATALSISIRSSTMPPGGGGMIAL